MSTHNMFLWRNKNIYLIPTLIKTYGKPEHVKRDLVANVGKKDQIS